MHIALGRNTNFVYLVSMAVPLRLIRGGQHECHCEIRTSAVGSPSFLEFKSTDGFPGVSVSKESACSTGDLGLIPESGRSSGEGNDNPLQYFCLEIPWTEESGGLQSMRLQSQTRFSN